MAGKPYYLAYENRYQKVFQAGIANWGHMADDEVLFGTLKLWVEENDIQGKKVVEFACGEGACGVILSRLGCVYQGFDIAPSAVEKARGAIAPFPKASVDLLDMVSDKVTSVYDAALDSMGYHMLVLDSDRRKYLRNAFDGLLPGAPMLFFRESFRENEIDEEIASFDQWKEITGDDYDTPKLRSASQNGIDIEFCIPLLPARARNEEGYRKEMEQAGFVVDEIILMEANNQIMNSVSIFVHKPK